MQKKNMISAVSQHKRSSFNTNKAVKESFKLFMQEQISKHKLKDDACHTIDGVQFTKAELREFILDEGKSEEKPREGQAHIAQILNRVLENFGTKLKYGDDTDNYKILQRIISDVVRDNPHLSINEILSKIQGQVIDRVVTTFKREHQVVSVAEPVNVDHIRAIFRVLSKSIHSAVKNAHKEQSNFIQVSNIHTLQQKYGHVYSNGNSEKSYNTATTDVGVQTTLNKAETFTQAANSIADKLRVQLMSDHEVNITFSSNQTSTEEFKSDYKVLQTEHKNKYFTQVAFRNAFHKAFNDLEEDEQNILRDAKSLNFNDDEPTELSKALEKLCKKIWVTLGKPESSDLGQRYAKSLANVLKKEINLYRDLIDATVSKTEDPIFSNFQSKLVIEPKRQWYCLAKMERLAHLLREGQSLSRVSAISSESQARSLEDVKNEFVKELRQLLTSNIENADRVMRILRIPLDEAAALGVGAEGLEPDLRHSKAAKAFRFDNSLWDIQNWMHSADNIFYTLTQPESQRLLQQSLGRFEHRDEFNDWSGMLMDTLNTFDQNNTPVGSGFYQKHAKETLLNSSEKKEKTAVFRRPVKYIDESKGIERLRDGYKDYTLNSNVDHSRYLNKVAQNLLNKIHDYQVKYYDVLYDLPFDLDLDSYNGWGSHFQAGFNVMSDKRLNEVYMQILTNLKFIEKKVNQHKEKNTSSNKKIEPISARDILQESIQEARYHLVRSSYSEDVMKAYVSSGTIAKDGYIPFNEIGATLVGSRPKSLANKADRDLFFAGHGSSEMHMHEHALAFEQNRNYFLDGFESAFGLAFGILNIPIVPSALLSTIAFNLGARAFARLTLTPVLGDVLFVGYSTAIGLIAGTPFYLLNVKNKKAAIEKEIKRINDLNQQEKDDVEALGDSEKLKEYQALLMQAANATGYERDVILNKLQAWHDDVIANEAEKNKALIEHNKQKYVNYIKNAANINTLSPSNLLPLLLTCPESVRTVISKDGLNTEDKLNNKKQWVALAKEEFKSKYGLIIDDYYFDQLHDQMNCGEKNLHVGYAQDMQRSALHSYEHRYRQKDQSSYDKFTRQVADFTNGAVLGDNQSVENNVKITIQGHSTAKSLIKHLNDLSIEYTEDQKSKDDNNNKVRVTIQDIRKKEKQRKFYTKTKPQAAVYTWHNRSFGYIKKLVTNVVNNSFSYSNAQSNIKQYLHYFAKPSLQERAMAHNLYSYEYQVGVNDQNEPVYKSFDELHKSAQEKIIEHSENYYKSEYMKKETEVQRSMSEDHITPNSEE